MPRESAPYPAEVGLFDQILDDAAMFPPGSAGADQAVREHLQYRADWFAPLIGLLVVPDSALGAVGRAAAPSGGPLPVSVVNTSGAGGLAALADRRLNGLEIVAVESALRDLDDLAGNAARVVSAAGELDPSIAVYVELPYAPGWQRAAAVVEAAGAYGKIRTGGLEPTAYPSPEQLADQLSALVEADLAFKATAGLHRAWPNTGRDAAGRPLAQHGFLSVLLAVSALVDGAEPADAADLLRLDDRERIAETVRGWDQPTITRVRRRFRSFGCCGVLDPIGDLVDLGLLAAPQ